MEPKIHFLRFGLTDKEACLAEAAAIDLIGIRNLTNSIAGYHDSSFGRIDSAELLAKHHKVKKIRHRAVLITINKRYRSDMSQEELYEATRGIWKIGTRRNLADYAMAVFHGIVREVYCIHQWYPAGTLNYNTRSAYGFKSSGRWEFEGSIAEAEIRDKYINKFIGNGTQNPIKYVNI